MLNVTASPDLAPVVASTARELSTEDTCYEVRVTNRESEETAESLVVSDGTDAAGRVASGLDDLVAARAGQGRVGRPGHRHVDRELAGGARADRGRGHAARLAGEAADVGARCSARR